MIKIKAAALGKLTFAQLLDVLAWHLSEVVRQTGVSALRRGIDGVTWQSYGKNLKEKEKLKDLHDRVHRGSIRHTIFHSEIFHGLYALNKIQLRHVLDLALIRARHEGAIDWNELDHRFSTSGRGEVLATYLYFSDELLGSARAEAQAHAAEGRHGGVV